MINDILDFSKIEAGKLDLDPVDFMLRDIIDNVCDLFRDEAYKKGIELITVVSEECRYALRGDSQRLEQILINIIGNAIKFTDSGEIILQVVTKEQLTDPQSSGPIVLEYSVRDTGIGMSQQQVAKLFQSFEQADSSTTRKYGGSGLGLTISKRLVEMMGGQIWAESTPGGGTTLSFTVTLERVPQAEKTDDLLPPEELGQLRVLVVDDCQAARNSLESVLHLFSFNVTTVASGKEALTLLESGATAQNQFHLVLLDWQMPDMDGVETARQIIKATASTSSKVHIILLTNLNHDEEMVNNILKAGVDAVLQKPINCSLLFDSIMESFGQEVVKACRPSRDGVDLQLIAEQIGGARVLLAEDNAVNRQVACEILESVGLIVEHAEDGARAVQKVMESEYDTVLMDIQMPAMDGHMATQKIRSDGRFQKLPIIAMTAHAMRGDREKSLASGMNDHVSKPIDKKLLFATLIKWITPKERQQSIVLPQVFSIENVPDLPRRLPGIDVDAALERVNQNHRLLQSILLEFHRDFANAAEKIRVILAGKRVDDMKEAMALAHSVKGMSGNLSAKRLFIAAVALESSIKSGQREEWSGLLENFDDALGQVVESIDIIKRGAEKSAAEAVTVASAPLDRENMVSMMREFLDMLLECNGDAQNSFDTLKPHLSGAGTGAEVRDAVQRLEESLDIFDFTKARASLHIIAKKWDITLEDDIP